MLLRESLFLSGPGRERPLSPILPIFPRKIGTPLPERSNTGASKISLETKDFAALHPLFVHLLRILGQCISYKRSELSQEA
jgi:hypothetical protein